MNYRISTAQLQQNGLNGIMKNQAEIGNIISQISSGLRNDLDPVERVQQLSYTVKISNSAQNIRNGETVLPRLVSQESALSGINEKLIQLQEDMTAASNPTNNDADRAGYAITMNGIKENIVNLINTRDEHGNYIFSGYKTNTTSFSDINTYNGDQGVRKIRIGDDTLVNENITGDKVITQNVMNAFKKFEDFLSTGKSDPSMLTSVQSAIDDISLQQTIVGGNINKINTFKSISDETTLQDQARLSQIQDADISALAAKLASAKTASEASLKSYAVIQNMSLFNYI